MDTRQREIDEVEGEIVFHQVLLDTLDLDAEDFYTMKQDYEEKLSELKDKLTSLTDDHVEPDTNTSNPNEHHPTTPGADSSGQNFALPSRHLGFQSSARHNTSHRSRLPSSAPAAESSSAAPKRPRHESECASPDEGDQQRSPKSRERSIGLSSNTSKETTPDIRGSNDLAEQLFHPRGGHNDAFSGSSLMHKFQEMQRKREEQYRQSQEDALLARQLHMSNSSSANSPSTSHESRLPTTQTPAIQSYLDASGSIQRSIPTPAVMQQMGNGLGQASLAVQDSQQQGDDNAGPSASASSTFGVHPSSYGHYPSPTHQTTTFASAFDEDGRVHPAFEETYPLSNQVGTTTAASQPQPLLRQSFDQPTIWPTAEQLGYSLDSSYSNVQGTLGPFNDISQLGGPMASYYDLGAVNFTEDNPNISSLGHLPESSSSSSSIEEISESQFARTNAFEYPLHRQTSWMPSTGISGSHDMMPGTFPVDPAGDMSGTGAHDSFYLQNLSSSEADNDVSFLGQRLVGQSSTMSGPIPGYDNTSTHYSSYSEDHMSYIRQRGLEYLLNDPSRSTQDIENLIKNVRPDEDIPPEMRTGTPAALSVSLMEHQKLGLAWLIKQEEESTKGGILADDMGLGKTIQALALMVSRPSRNPARKTTLIVAPVSLLRQWQSEIVDKLRRDYQLEVYVYHGPKKNITFELLRKYDVVLTTYGKITAEWSRNQQGGIIFGDNSLWYRVILDEAQYIKNRSTKASRAASDLRSIYRLAMTGTPMMNRVNELYPLIKFLRIPPYNSLDRFNCDFTRPISSANTYFKDRAMTRLQALLKAVLLRRTKESKIDGAPIINLPPKRVEVVHAVFNEDQKQFYEAIETQARLQVNKYLKTGAVGRNYSYILVRLLRMRQACCHPHLCKDFATDGGVADLSQEEMEELAINLSSNVVERIMAANGAFECPICYDAIENPLIIFPCGHNMCSECLSSMTDPSRAVANGDESADLKCPECRGRLNLKKIVNYKAFKLVHMPEEEQDATNALLEPDEDDSDTDKSETDTESDLGSDDSDTGTEADEDDDDCLQSDSDSSTARNTRDNGKFRYESNNDSQEVVPKSEPQDDSESDVVASTAARQRSSRRKVKSEAQDDDPDAEFGPSTTSPEQSRKRKTKRQGKGHGKKRNKKTKSKAKSVNLADLRVRGLRNIREKRKYLRRIRRTWITSAKIEKTREILQSIKARDPTEKTLIFSQFTSFLDLLEVGLDEDKWDFRRYDGSMNAGQRADAVHDFMTSSEVKVMLVSLKAGNAGLNLTKANNVIILDPFWNPFIEDQAVDRAHRIGQSRPVTVHRVLVKDTVEDRIISLQENKRELITRALDEKDGQNLSRLGARELAYLFGITSNLPTTGSNNSGDPPSSRLAIASGSGSGSG